MTNTGTITDSFVVELQANTGQVSLANALFLPPGQTATWQTAFSGTVTARIVRITTAVLLF